MAAVPVMGGRRRARVELAGALPDPTHVPRGCRFHPRCPEATATCPEREPDLRQTDPGRMVACHLYG
jgi:peptide/nickel transport system ATP-binding protein